MCNDCRRASRRDFLAASAAGLAAAGLATWLPARPANAKVKDDRAEFFHHQSRDLMSLAAALHKREIRSVLVEAGPTLGSALINAGLIDELAVFTAPKLLGEGPSFLGSIGIDSIDKALQLAQIESKTFGTDSFTRYQFIKAGN